MNVLIAATSLQPAYGGPAFSVARLALTLAGLDVRIGVWSPDGSALDTPLLPQAARLMALGGSPEAALERFGHVDVLHDNGIWLRHHHQLAALARRAGVPRVVTIRGTLEPWAFRHKWLKKQVAWRLYQRRDLMSAAAHHATSSSEAENLAGYRLGVPIRMVPNGVDLAVCERAPGIVAATPDGPRTALFLGRIYPVKGLPMLIEAWARLAPESWRLDIAGPDEAGHRGEVERLVREKGLGGVVRFLGPVAGRDKTAALHSADLLVLPTHSENFGMVVAEALAHGVPVVTTRGAPWPMLAAERCGWWVDISVDGIARGLAEAMACPRDELAQMGARGRDFVRREFAWGSVGKRMLDLYEDTASRHRAAA